MFLDAISARALRILCAMMYNLIYAFFLGFSSFFSLIWPFSRFQ
jgi:hypothetical protein